MSDRVNRLPRKFGEQHNIEIITLSCQRIDTVSIEYLRFCISALCFPYQNN